MWCVAKLARNFRTGTSSDSEADRKLSVVIEASSSCSNIVSISRCDGGKLIMLMVKLLLVALRRSASTANVPPINAEHSTVIPVLRNRLRNVR